MNQGLLLKFISLRHLLREKRSWLTLVGVALGISVFVSIRIANRSVLDAYRQSVDAFVGETTLEVVGKSGAIDERLLIDLREAHGISEISPIVQSVLPMAQPAVAQGEMLLLMGIDLFQERHFRRYDIEAGKKGVDLTTAFETLLDPASAFLTASFAKHYGLRIGDPFSVRSGVELLPFKVAGLIKGEGIARTRDGNIAFLDIASAQWRFDKVGQLNRIDLITDDRVPLDTLIAGLEKQLGNGVHVRRPQQRNRHIEKMLFSFQMNLTALSAISLFVGLFLIYNTLLVSVAHRKKEIGMLRALGVDCGEIFRLFTLEGMVIGIAGGFLGVLTGALLARWVVQVLSTTVTSLYVAIPPTPFSLPPLLFVEGLIIGVLVATFSALYPAWQAGRLKPREAMEGIYHSEGPGFNDRGLLGIAAVLGLAAFLLCSLPMQWGLSWNGYIAAALLLAAFSLLVPSAIFFFSRLVRLLSKKSAPAWRLAQGHLEQAIRRNAPTVSAFMAALAMMISVVIMIESYRTTVLIWIDQSIQADVIGFPASYMASDSDESMPESILNEIVALLEVKAVDGYRSRMILFRDTSVELAARDLSVHAAYSDYLFRAGNRDRIFRQAAQGEAVLVSEVLANRFGLREGEHVALPTPQGPMAFEIAGIFYDYGTDGGKMVVDRSHVQNKWRDRRIDALLVYLDEEADAVSVRQQLLATWGAAQGLAFTTQGDFKTEIMDIFDQTFLITYALEWIAIAVALLGIANTLFVSILERRREIGILRAVGASRPQVIRIVMIEAFYMGVIGNVIALICGFFLSLLLIFVINKASFGWTLQFYFPPEILLHSFLVAVGAALLAAFFPACKAARTDLKEAIAYE
ncbi:MAG: ABC transporter permease [Nitrospiria bacterium]